MYWMEGKSNLGEEIREWKFIVRVGNMNYLLSNFYCWVFFLNLINGEKLEGIVVRKRLYKLVT